MHPSSPLSSVFSRVVVGMIRLFSRGKFGSLFSRGKSVVTEKVIPSLYSLLLFPFSPLPNPPPPFVWLCVFVRLFFFSALCVSCSRLWGGGGAFSGVPWETTKRVSQSDDDVDDDDDDTKQRQKRERKKGGVVY